MKATSQYINTDGVLVSVYPEKRVKRNPYSWGGSYALLGAIAKRGIPTEGCMFTPITRRRIK
jgi:hypothetical protein